MLEPPVFVASIILPVWASLPEAGPLPVSFRPVWRVFTRKKYFLHIAGVLAYLIGERLGAKVHSRLGAPSA